MLENNKRNLLFFEAASMRGLHAMLDTWQEENQKRFLSVCVQRDGDWFCCIALTNPTEVIITSGYSSEQANVMASMLLVRSA